MLFKDIKPLNNINIESREQKNTNYLETTLSLTINSDNNLTNILIENMEKINNSLLQENNRLLSESTANIFTTLKNFFVRLWDSINKMWNKFMNSHKVLPKGLEDFLVDCVREITELDGKKYRGFTYSIENKQIDLDFDIFADNLTKTQTLDLIKLGEYEKKVKSEDYYNEIRGKIIGKNYIYPEDYSREICAYFRDGYYKERDIDITHELKDRMISSIHNYRETYGSCQKLKLQMDTFYKDVINYFNTMVSITKEGDIAIFSHTEKDNRIYRSNNYSVKDNSKETFLNYQKLATLKAEEAKKISTILNMTFAAKLDAINERYVVYLRVLKSLMKEKVVGKYVF